MIHPDFLEDNLTSKQISEWEAYDRLDPIGAWKGDFHMAYLAMTMTNLAISVHGKKGTKLCDLKDFLPNWSGDLSESDKLVVQSADDMKKFLLNFAKEHNKDIVKKKADLKKPPMLKVQKEKKDGR